MPKILVSFVTATRTKPQTNAQTIPKTIRTMFLKKATPALDAIAHPGLWCLNRFLKARWWDCDDLIYAALKRSSQKRSPE
jgi:hypothetical protein